MQLARSIAGAHTIALLAAFLAPFAAAQPAAASAPPGRLVEVDGRQLHLHCTGEGSPTVIFEAGASAFALDFSFVQPELTRTTRVCSYDRAGHGWSCGESNNSSVKVVEDLHRLLQAAGEKPPYVLAGASMGGLYARSYVRAHPDEVAGLVLIDPASEDRLFTMFEGRPRQIAELTAEQLLATAPTTPMKVPRRPPQTGAPFDMLPRELYEARIAFDRRLIESVPLEVSADLVRFSMVEDHRGLSALLQQRKTEPHPLGARPTIVLTRGVDSDPQRLDTHRQLALLSTNSRHQVVAHAGREIHLFTPDAVIAAVADVVKAVREDAQLHGRIIPDE